MHRRRLRARVLTVLVVVAPGVWACDGPTDAPVAGAELQEIQADNVIYGLHSYVTSAGVRQGMVRADTAYLYADSAKLVMYQVDIIFYDDQGKERATVTALSGEMDENTDKMVARGDVVLVVREDGRKIETSELFYDPQLERIWSDSATIMTERDGTVTRGSAFKSDIEFKNVRVENIRGGGNIIF